MPRSIPAPVPAVSFTARSFHRVSPCSVASHDALKADNAQWSALPSAGVQHVHADDTGAAYDIEMRTCACGSTLGKVAP
jgi:hypothetical protein